MKYAMVVLQDYRCKMRNNAKGIGRSKIKPHEEIRAGAGEFMIYK